MNLHQAYEEALYKAQMEEDKEMIEHYLKVIEKLKLKMLGKSNKP